MYMYGISSFIILLVKGVHYCDIWDQICVWKLAKVSF